MTQTIFNEMNNSATPAALFDLTYEYFRGQGFGAMCYVTPSSAAGSYLLMDRGMPEDWMQRYRDEDLRRVDPIPSMAFRIGHPERVKHLIDRLTGLSPEERDFVEAFKSSGLADGLVIPAYGPLGRPGLIGLARLAHPDLLDELDVPLAGAVAQAMHTGMELLQIKAPTPGLSPREREILTWMCKGKSNVDIATIVGLAVPTVTTHIQRIYGKLRVNDRVSACAKATAHHYL